MRLRFDGRLFLRLRLFRLAGIPCNGSDDAKDDGQPSNLPPMRPMWARFLGRMRGLPRLVGEEVRQPPALLRFRVQTAAQVVPLVLKPADDAFKKGGFLLKVR